MGTLSANVFTAIAALRLYVLAKINECHMIHPHPIDQIRTELRSLPLRKQCKEHNVHLNKLDFRVLGGTLQCDTMDCRTASSLSKAAVHGSDASINTGRDQFYRSDAECSSARVRIMRKINRNSSQQLEQAYLFWLSSIQWSLLETQWRIISSRPRELRRRLGPIFCVDKPPAIQRV